ncbi:ROK family transcriptional regulator [Nakamurella lactea]|uniref:ROK family transcriptional regulator n=1 Tax=Nakamurella lactea TaxID=459515 RepID=UPI00041F96C0|nr:ROK family transcriptional regulator [Nakamurella lactea]
MDPDHDDQRSTPAGGRSADSPRLLREINDQVVLGLLLEQGPMTRATIGQQSGLSKPTVSSLLSRLEQRSLVVTTGEIANGPGPRARIYAVNPTAAYVIGIHVEQHGCVAALAGLTGEIVASCTVDVPARRRSAPVDEIGRAVSGVLAKAGVSGDDVQQVLIATPGVIDPVTGALRHARHLSGWESPDLIAELTSTLGIRVSHGNDVNLAAVAEGVHGSAKGQHDYALLWLDRGVGLGMVLDGRLRHGAHGGAGEVGYLPVPGVERPRVDRGAPGAFQQLVGGQSLHALARRYGIRRREPAAIVTAALAAGAAGQPLIDELADGVATGAAAITTLLDPGLLVLGGPVGLAGGNVLLDKVLVRMRQISFVRPQVVLSTVTADGVLRGAVEVALNEARTVLFGRQRPGLPAGAV